MIAIQFPSVQTKLVNKASTFLSDKIKFPIHVEGVDIYWFDEIVLEGVTVYDPWKSKMVYIKRAIVDIEVISLPKGQIDVDKITLSNGEVNMIRYAPDGANNLTDFVSALQDLSPPRKKGQKPVPFVIKEVELQNMMFSFFDKRKPFETEIFDHNHFYLDSIYSDISNLRVVADTFQIDVKSLSTVDRGTKLKAHNLTTLFTLTKSNMTFENLEARIGSSVVKNYLEFKYDNINDLSDFIEKTTIVTRLDESIVDFNDLEKFAVELKAFKEVVKISGNARGKVIHFTMDNLNMNFGKSSNIKGKISFDGLPSFFETFIDFKFKNSHVLTSDLTQYISSDNANGILKKFVSIQGSGTFIGFPEDFVTSGTFSTGLGKLKSDIRLNAKKPNEKPEYKGDIEASNFNLGKLLDQERVVQFVDMKGSVEGAGFKLENTELSLNADIKKLGLFHYNYKNISTQGKLDKKTYKGFISVNDSNLVLEADGNVRFAKDNEAFNIKARLEKANLKPLGISDIEAMVRTDMDLNFTGTKIDDIIGNANFKNTYLLFNKTKEISIDSLYAISSKDGENRIIEAHSNLLSFKAEGNFNPTTLYEDLDRLYNEYKLTIDNDRISIANYYQNRKNLQLKNYKVDFDINVKNLNPIFEFYTPSLYLSQGLTIEGNFRNGNNSIFNLNTHIDTLYYKENEIFNTDIEISTSKMADSSDILAMVFVNSNKQNIVSLPATNSFVLEGIWDKNAINFTTQIQQTSSTNKIELEGTFSFLENSKQMLSIEHSNINLLKQHWTIAPDNKILFANKEIEFHNLKLADSLEYFELNGTISDNTDEEAQLNIGNFNLSTLNSLFPNYNLGGVLNANVNIKDLYRDLNLDGDVKIDQLSIDKFIVGNVIGNAKWDNIARKLLLDIQLERNNLATININGFVLPETATSKEVLDLTADLQNADLEILSPILKGVLSDLSGKVTGKLKVNGTIKDPEINGEALVRNGKFKIDYLGTTYHFNDTIFLEPNNIGFKRMRIRDDYGNRGTIQGGIAHDKFKKFIVDISGTMNDLNVLKTTEKDNNLFYGDAFVNGDFSILGPFEDLTINANATSRKGTKIFIPLSTSEAAEKQSFINFTDKKLNTAKLAVKDSIDLSGLNLNFNFELTPDAYAEIIFDKRTGDIIRGYGNGNIKMTIDTRGDFNMYGDYRIAKGAYNYTLAGLISKEFTIQPNSSITWTGDPYGGILDVEAFFENKVSLIPLDTSIRKDETGRTHPTKVILDITGDLMSPQIAFDIDITPTTGPATHVATEFEAKIKRDEQLLNKEVFSLLVLGNFTPENSFSGVGGSTSNVSQLLTNQLGNWLSQVDENLVVDIDLNGLDKDALNTFNLRLSYTALDGRLRISRDGSFSNMQNNPNSQQSISNIAGEWTVEYLLSKDGKFRLKLYNKNNQNQLMNNSIYNNYTSAGFSILHTQSFNSLSDLFNGKNKKKQSEEDEKSPPTQIIIPNSDKKTEEDEKLVAPKDSTGI